MSIEQMRVVCEGAKALGMKLVGDNFIGYKFCDGQENLRDGANELLQSFFQGELLQDDEHEYTQRVYFLGTIRDEDYSHARWEQD